MHTLPTDYGPLCLITTALILGDSFLDSLKKEKVFLRLFKKTTPQNDVEVVNSVIQNALKPPFRLLQN